MKLYAKIVKDKLRELLFILMPIYLPSSAIWLAYLEVHYLNTYHFFELIDLGFGPMFLAPVIALASLVYILVKSERTWRSVMVSVAWYVLSGFLGFGFALGSMYEFGFHD